MKTAAEYLLLAGNAETMASNIAAQLQRAHEVAILQTDLLTECAKLFRREAEFMADREAEEKAIDASLPGQAFASDELADPPNPSIEPCPPTPT